jgi:hypothetical protein
VRAQDALDRRTDREAERAADRNARLALAAFVFVLVGALVLYVYFGRRDYWFRGDDWDFLVLRDGGSIRSLFEDHHNHWSTVPILEYRALWRVFGLDYDAYLLPVVVLHLTAAVLLRALMRRALVGPWIATVVASAFALLAGAGWNNILWSFQSGFNGSLVCGLAYLLLADRDGPFDRRDLLGLGFGLVGLMCSGVGVTMAIVVALAVLIRRGWAMALAHAVPLLVAFGAWYLWSDPRVYADTGGSAGVASLARFVGRGIYNAFDELVMLGGGAVALLTISAIGLGLAWSHVTRAELRRRAAAPAALLTGMFVFFVIVGAGRGPALDTDYATTSRFVHIGLALAAVPVAVAIEGFARRARVVAVVLCVLLLAGATRHVVELWTDGPKVNSEKPRILAAVSVPAFDDVPDFVRPFPERVGRRSITVGWLRDGVASSRIEPLDDIGPVFAADTTMRLALRQTASDAAADCHQSPPLRTTLQRGDSLEFSGAILVRLEDEEGTLSNVRGFTSASGGQIEALSGPLTLSVEAYPGVPTFACSTSASSFSRGSL